MKFYKIWTRATKSAAGPAGHFDVTSFGYSNSSLDEALRIAEERAEAAATAIAAGQLRGDDYYDTGRPFREEVVEEFSRDGEQIAVISRNRYGALVLNTTEVFFADVDKPIATWDPVGSLLGMFGFKKKSGSFEERLVEDISNNCERDRSLGLRLYRTKAGYRIVVTSRTIRSGDPDAKSLLDSLRADKLYVALCRSQDCYRARLTPKPWRCGFRRPPAEFPFADTEQEMRFREWERQYDSVSQNFATCALIGQFGNQQISPECDQIIQLHDHYALNGELPLA